MIKPHEETTIITPYVYPGLPKIRIKQEHARRLQLRNQWFEQILEYVAKNEGVTVSEVCSSSRKREIVFTRFIIVHLCKIYLRMTEYKITYEFQIRGLERERSTINYAQKALTRLGQSSRLLRERIENYENWAKHTFI